MLRGVMEQGGAVLWVIVACGVLALVVFLERSLHLHRARIMADDFLKGIVNILKRGNVREALTICKETPGPVALIVQTAIEQRARRKEDIRSAIDDASRAELSRMERRLVVIATVSQTAPLLGLLGTMLGMIEVLLALQLQAPLIQSADVFGGMMKALVTSAAGLMVAIPCYAAFNLLVIKIDRLVLDMERAATEIIRFLSSAEEETGETADHEHAESK